MGYDAFIRDSCLSNVYSYTNTTLEITYTTSIKNSYVNKSNLVKGYRR